MLSRFKLIKHVPVQCYRKTPGSYVDGDYIEGFEVPFSINANVQPLKYKELLLMKESDRAREWITIYTPDLVKGEEPGDEGYRGDIVEWEGFRYQIVKVKHYSLTGLNHHQAQAARLETTVVTSYPESE